MAETFFVLGANSFAGACTTKQLLQSGYQVIGLNRSNEKHNCFHPYRWTDIEGDYHFHQLDNNQHTDQIVDLYRQHSPNYVMDFSGQGMVAESWENPEQWYQTNLVAKSKLVSAFADNPMLKRYVRASTPEVYGSHLTQIAESNDYKPSTPYAISHVAIDLHIQSWFKQKGFPAVIARFANFYGPGQQLYRIIPRTIIYAKLGKQLSLHGGGKAKRAFIYGEDAAAGMIACATNGLAGETYHFSSERLVSIRELVEIICDMMEIDIRDFAITSEDRQGKDLQYYMKDDKARQTLEWATNTNLHTGIHNTIRWVEKYWEHISKAPLEYVHKV